MIGGMRYSKNGFQFQDAAGSQVRGAPPLYQVPAPGAEAPMTASPPYSLESNKKEQL